MKIHLVFVLIFSSIVSITSKEIVDYFRIKFRQFEAQTQNERNVAELISKMKNFFKAVDQELPRDVKCGLNNYQSIRNSDILSDSFETILSSFKKLDNLGSKKPKKTAINFAKSVIKGQNSVARALKDIEAAVDGGLFIDFKIELLERNCKDKQSVHENLYFLHQTINSIELRGYFLMILAYRILEEFKEIKKGNVEKYKIISRIRAETNANILNTIGKRPLSIWRCDPKKHVEGQTYVQLGNIFQGYIVNKRDLVKNLKCPNKPCSDFHNNKQYNCTVGEQFCNQNKLCKGHITDCIDYKSPNVCISSETSNRRYQHNSKKKCSKKSKVNLDSLKIDCPFCFCLCEEPDQSTDRFFSLLPNIADTPNNMVVVGLRFIKKDRVVHLQIKQGKLLPYGKIDEKSIAWVPIHHKKVSNETKGIYYEMSPNNTAIDLGDVEADDHHVVTGVQLRVIRDHLKIGIHTTMYSYRRGELLDPENVIWRTKSSEKPFAVYKARTDEKYKTPEMFIKTESENGQTRTRRALSKFTPPKITRYQNSRRKRKISKKLLNPANVNNELMTDVLENEKMANEFNRFNSRSMNDFFSTNLDDSSSLESIMLNSIGSHSKLAQIKDSNKTSKNPFESEEDDVANSNGISEHHTDNQRYSKGSQNNFDVQYYPTPPKPPSDTTGLITYPINSVFIFINTFDDQNTTVTGSNNSITIDRPDAIYTINVINPNLIYEDGAPMTASSEYQGPKVWINVTQKIDDSDSTSCKTDKCNSESSESTINSDESEIVIKIEEESKSETDEISSDLSIEFHDEDKSESAEEMGSNVSVELHDESNSESAEEIDSNLSIEFHGEANSKSEQKTGSNFIVDVYDEDNSESTKKTREKNIIPMITPTTKSNQANSEAPEEVGSNFIVELNGDSNSKAIEKTGSHFSVELYDEPNSKSGEDMGSNFIVESHDEANSKPIEKTSSNFSIDLYHEANSESAKETEAKKRISTIKPATSSKIVEANSETTGEIGTKKRISTIKPATSSKSVEPNSETTEEIETKKRISTIKPATSSKSVEPNSETTEEIEYVTYVDYYYRIETFDVKLDNNTISTIKPTTSVELDGDAGDGEEIGEKNTTPMVKPTMNLKIIEPNTESLEEIGSQNAGLDGEANSESTEEIGFMEEDLPGTDLEDPNVIVIDEEEIENRTEINLNDLDVPVKSPVPSTPDDNSNTFIKVTTTSIAKDNAQTSIPFIDIQPVEMAIPHPLTGVGLFYKGSPGFGGFIAIKIITYDFNVEIEQSG